MSGQTSARRTKSASGEAGFEGLPLSEGFERFERFEGLLPLVASEGSEGVVGSEDSEGSEYSERAWGSAGSGATWWRQEVRHSAMAAAKRICL